MDERIVASAWNGELPDVHGHCMLGCRSNDWCRALSKALHRLRAIAIFMIKTCRKFDVDVRTGQAAFILVRYADSIV